MIETTTTLLLIGILALYYVLMWLWIGRDPKPGTIVTLYEPPRGLSPAMIRYIWKQEFDERVVWAGFLSLVSQGLATLTVKDGVTFISVPKSTPPKTSGNKNRKKIKRERARLHPPEEEGTLLRGLANQSGKPIRLSLLEYEISAVAHKMFVVLRRKAVDRWFQENRKSLVPGIVLSAIALLVAASFGTEETFKSLFICMPLIIVSSFYLFVVGHPLMRLVSLAREHPEWVVLKRMATLAFFCLCAVCGIAAASAVMIGNQGWPVVMVMLVSLLLNGLFLQLIKAPTREGRKLLDEIEGFRHFLQTVEQLPLDWPDAPATSPGLYEKYLPYALALEVEQEWCDKLNALASTDIMTMDSQRANLFCLGMWDGKPVEVAYSGASNGRVG